jgi:hypothetical protein
VPMAVVSKGSWSEASGSPAQVAAALALPGSWKWYPGATTVLVRGDQLASLPADAIASITPATGAALAAHAVSIVGSGFTGATGATINAIACTAFVVVDDAHITCSTPATLAAGGPYALVVQRPGGNLTKAAAYTAT